MKSKTFRCNVDIDNKVLKFYNKPSLEEFLNTISGDVLVTIAKPEDIRTKEQNSHYWGVLDTLLGIETFSGYTRHELHETFKEKFSVESTRDLEINEFINYMENIKAFVADFAHYRIQDPDEY